MENNVREGQTFVIFVGATKLCLIEQADNTRAVSPPFGKKEVLEKVSSMIREEMEESYLEIVVKNLEHTIEYLKKHLVFIKAAGGVVKKDGDLLFIHRLGKWDLPKGKLEKGELEDEAAVREVEEECAVKATLNEKIGCTYHTYQMKGKSVLKETHWYFMNCFDDRGMTPQEEEDIKEVQWVKPNELSDVLSDTYDSIRYIFDTLIPSFKAGKE